MQTSPSPQDSAALAPAESTATLARRLAAAPDGHTPAVPRLMVQGGSFDGLALRLEKQGHPYRIGRSAGCQLVLADDDMSREHAEIEWRWDGVFVRDLGSKNGLLLRGERLTSERRLADGDVVEMGQTRFMLDDTSDRHLRQLQDGAGQASGPQMADTHTAPRVSIVSSEHISSQALRMAWVRPRALLVIAVVVLVATIGLALSFLLAR